LLAQGRQSEAEKIAGAAVRTLLEKGDESRLLAEALTAQAVALARLGQHAKARPALERAFEIAEQAQDAETAGLAALTLIEELHPQLGGDEMREAYRRADQRLAASQGVETLERLRACARLVMDATHGIGSAERDARFIYAREETGALLRRATRVAATDSPVLITGETGTGKEILSRLIHQWSGRAGQFIAVNCRALTDLLIESQLFGHMKGGFIDALQDHAGAVREAAGGTLFLDEVAELSHANQGKVLRLIEREEVHSIGTNLPEHINVRIIATTNHNLREEVACGSFRDDLFYRLQTFQLEIPPLRERPEDTIAIAQYFIEEACRRHRKRVMFTPESMEAIKGLTLEGNARQLRSIIERILLTAAEDTLIAAPAVRAVAQAHEQQEAEPENDWEGCSLEEAVLSYEKNLIRQALNASAGKVTRAAHLLGITHQLLSFILSTRHKDLIDARTPTRARRRSLMRRRPVADDSNKR
jgi:transcriptional regulator with PAS, ATPase and Fis domain